MAPGVLGGSLRGIHGAPRYTSRVPVSTLVWRTALGEHMIMSENQPSRNKGRATMDPTVQVRQRGFLTVPTGLRERYKIKPGDTFENDGSGRNFCVDACDPDGASASP